VSPRSHIKDGCCRQTTVSGPGQSDVVIERSQDGMSVASASSVVGAPTSTGGGIWRVRALASSNRWTASCENASAASP
jgi:hypothetical protein